MKRIDLTEFFGFPSEITYDPEASMAYLRVDPDETHYTVENDRVNLDYSKSDTLVGVEVFL